MKWLLAVAILAAAVAFYLAVTASYGDAQEVPTPVVDNPSMTDPTIVAMLATVVPRQAPSQWDTTFDGVVNVVDLQQTAAHMGETGLRPVCGIALYPWLLWAVRTC